MNIKHLFKAAILGVSAVLLSFSPVYAANGDFHTDILHYGTPTLPADTLFLTLPDYARMGAALSAYEKNFTEEKPDPALTPFEPVSIDKPDGEYSIGLDAVGGSGKSSISSPALLIIRDGKAYTQLEWSSANYDYMIVGGEKYLPINPEGNSVFEVPVSVLDTAMPVLADTTAMGTPHEISYALTFYSETIGSKGQMPREAAKRVLGIAFVIILGGGILSHFTKKRRMQ